MTNCGPKEEVKLGLVNAIRSRRVAQGLEEMPAMEPKKPRIESVRRLKFSICFESGERFIISSCGFETIHMIIAVFRKFTCPWSSRSRTSFPLTNGQRSKRQLSKSSTFINSPFDKTKFLCFKPPTDAAPQFL